MFPVRHVPAMHLGLGLGLAPAEDAAVVVEAGDAALAGGAVVRRLAHVLDVVAALAARVLGLRLGPPD